MKSGNGSLSPERSDNGLCSFSNSLFFFSRFFSFFHWSIRLICRGCVRYTGVSLIRWYANCENAIWKANWVFVVGEAWWGYFAAPYLTSWKSFFQASEFQGSIFVRLQTCCRFWRKAFWGLFTRSRITCNRVTHVFVHIGFLIHLFRL